MSKSKTLSILKPDLKKVILAPILKLFEVAGGLAIPFMIKYIIDDGIAKNDTKTILNLSLAIIAITLLNFFITMIAQYLAARVAADYGYRLKEKLYQKLSTISEKDLAKFGKEKVLTLISSDSYLAQNGVMMFMRIFLRPVFVVLGSITAAYIIHYQAGLIFTTTTLLSLTVIFAVVKITGKKYIKVQETIDSLNKRSASILDSMRVVKAFSNQDSEKIITSNINQDHYDKSLNVAKINALSNPLTFFFINLAIVLIIIVAYNFLDTNGGITPGEIASLISFLISTLTALFAFSLLVVSLNKAFSSVSRLDSFFDIPDIIENINKDIKYDDNKPLIEFKNVYFSYYDNDKYVLEDISFIINKDDSFGIIGGTGSGKSTIILLLLKIYKVSKGEILYKGVNINDIPFDSYIKNFTPILQQSSLFKGTILSNIDLFESKDENRLIQSLKDSKSYEFVSQYEDSYNHIVNEKGTNYSGGQKQRILLARALYNIKETLILDDSLNALDYITDLKVRENISKIKNLTNIIVSQKCTSLTKCKNILVIDDGKVIDIGSHNTLLERCSLYKSIFEIQKGRAK